MAIWFLDTTNGNDANDGRQSIALSGTVASLTFAAISQSLLVNVTIYHQILVGNMLYLSKTTDPSVFCWARVSAKTIITPGPLYILTLVWVAGDAFGDLGSTVDIDGTGPVKTLSKLQSLMVPSDTGYSVPSPLPVITVWPTSEPVSELAALALKAQLETITISNGYTIDIGEILRPAAIYVPIPADKQVIMRQPADRIADESAGMCEHHKQEFELCLMMRCSESDTVAIDTHANRFHAAVRKALLADWTLSGTTIDVQVGDLEQVESEEAIACYALTVVLTYRHADTNPYPA